MAFRQGNFARDVAHPGQGLSRLQSCALGAIDIESSRSQSVAKAPERIVHAIRTSDVEQPKTRSRVETAAD